MAGARVGPDETLNRVFTGILGGSFNPAHGGHRRVSLFALKALNLDEILWLVSPGNPLKNMAANAPLVCRYAAARNLARRSRIRVSAIEREFGTRFTIDSLRRLQRRYPKRRFIWLMGSDNLAQFAAWKNWRGIARAMPIAVIARPGYEAQALASPAMAWLRRYRTPLASIRTRKVWSAPALIMLRFDPDPRSATAIRQADPQWATRLSTRGLRDGLTHRPVPA